MKTHQLFDAIEKLLPHAEAEQENLYRMAKENPDEYQAGYEDCRHAVSYAYEALREQGCILRETLALAVTALNTAPRFPVPSLDSDSYKIASLCDTALAKAKEATNGKQLPPDPEGKNGDRAEGAGRAISAFQIQTGTDFDDALPDLLCNLMHWCDRTTFEDGETRIDFDVALTTARMHYEAETAAE
jgi:hypothetical protein